jgi:hypothetical protein
MLFFTASFDVTVEAKCITYVMLDSIWHHWHPFCISECIGPESFSAWNLTWHHQIYCFRALRHVRFGRWTMHRMQIAGARIGPLMQIAKSNLLWRNKAFDSSHGGKDIWICKHYMQMRQIIRREIPPNWRITNNLQSNQIQLLSSGKMERDLMPTMWNSIQPKALNASN